MADAHDREPGRYRQDSCSWRRDGGVAICGAGTQGQMEDNIRIVQDFKKMTPEEIADVRKRAIAGSRVYTGPTLEYWKKKA